MTSLPSCVKLLQECQKDLPLTNLFFSILTLWLAQLLI